MREAGTGRDLFRRRVAEFDDKEFAGEIHSGHGRYFKAAGFGVDNEDAVASYNDEEVSDTSIRDKKFLACEFSVSGPQLDVAEIPVCASFENGHGSSNFAAADRGKIFCLVR